MSRRRKRTASRRPLQFLLLGAGAVLVTLAVVLGLRPSREARGTPVVSVAPESIDFGRVKLDTPKTFVFTVTNTGQGTLRFDEAPSIEVLEGC